MNTAVARKRSPTPTAPTSGPAAIIEVTAPSEIHQVLMDWKRYPAPVRPLGSGSSTTRCIAANGGTQLDLSGLNRVLKIDTDTVTVQPGISLPDLAEVLSEEGLELVGLSERLQQRDQRPVGREEQCGARIDLGACQRERTRAPARRCLALEPAAR